MLLAAGRGKRLGKLTADTPKPLMEVGGKYLIAYHLESLARVGMRDIIINVAYCAKQIVDALGDGKRYGVSIQYSFELEDCGLETGGGILQALPLLGKKPFIVINSDILTHYSFNQLPNVLSGLAHIVLVKNPPFHPQGDFYLQGNKVQNHGDSRLTFAGIAVYHPDFFAHCKPGKFSVAPLLYQAADQGQLTGEHYQGYWSDIGTEERLMKLRNFVATSARD